MEEKTEKQNKNTVDKLPSGIEEVKKLHGARKSKVDPSQMTILQHEEAKLRIFRRIMILVVIGAVALIGVALYRYIAGKNADEQYIQKVETRLAELEATFSNEPEKLYSSAANAAEAARLAEDLAAFAITRNYPEINVAMQKKCKDYEKVILKSSPVGGAPFVASTALLDMVPIKAGTFLMGDSRTLAVKSETPCVEITISKDFWIARHEITNRQMRRLTPSHAIKEWNKRDLNANDLPAGDVSWDEAVLYCKTLTDKERKLGRVPEGYEYRLPTEAEWEYVCRAGTKTDYYWGNEFGAEGAKYANSLDIKTGKAFEWDNVAQPGVALDDRYEVAAPVGSYQPNAWGIHDMLGNVSEWCYDFYAPSTYGRLQMQNEKERIDPCNKRPEAVEYEQLKNFDIRSVVREIPCKVVRGGNWCCSPEDLRSASRNKMPQNEKNIGVGFRPVLAPIIKNKISNTVR